MACDSLYSAEEYSSFPANKSEVCVFTIYHSNDLDVQKDLLLHIMDKPLTDPFESEVILVQSPGMAQWLQWKITEAKGVASNIKFPLPASFIWQQYAANLPNVAGENPFNKTSITWRLMRLIPEHLNLPEFQPLQHYLAKTNQVENQKLYQLAYKIADLFDQYLVYRPEWLNAWEKQQEDQQFASMKAKYGEQIWADIRWQGILWRALVKDIQAQFGEHTVHRAHLHKKFLQLLNQPCALKLPQRIFVFGISALPLGYLESLKAMSQYCEVHLFFTNVCQEYWSDLVDNRFLQKLKLQQRWVLNPAEKKFEIAHQKNVISSTLSEDYETVSEQLSNEHSLLSSWGKLGRDFLYLLTELEQQNNVRGIEAYVEQMDTENNEKSLLSQIQQGILKLDGKSTFNLEKTDRSLSIHACHTAMREVEVLQDYLLHLFQQNPDITPKDVVVMSADIDRYTPYIQAVFGQKAKEEPSSIPFSITDNKLTENDVLIASFIHLLNLKQRPLSAEELLSLLDVPAIREKFQIELTELEQVQYWVEYSGIRTGLEKYPENETSNYNAWQAGLENMLLGNALREEHGIWQDSLGFDSSYGLQGQLTGKLYGFFERISQWHQRLSIEQELEKWQQDLTALVQDFFSTNEHNAQTLLYVQSVIVQTIKNIQQTQFNRPLDIDVIAEVLSAELQDDPNTMRFLAGRVNFCTLLPMRAIPFKVVCLLGMNERDYPRQQTRNSFDLMQYDYRKGDRIRRDDDCYLFLEALISAQQYFYVSYIGRSVVDNTEKQPSVLVNQLLDFIQDHLSSSQEMNCRDLLVQQHPMSVFHPDNYLQPKASFADQWLPLAQVQKTSQTSHFLQSLDYQITQEDRHIGLNDLIRFVQNPVEYFFKVRLGVSFLPQQETIPDSENFTLEGLTRYKINQELVYCDDKQAEQLFNKLNVKGVMPRGEFGRIYQLQQQKEIQYLKQNIEPYLHKDEDQQWCDFILPTSFGEVRIEGSLSHLYDQQLVLWRAGNLKDAHLIELWINYLVQCVCCEPQQRPTYYGKDGMKTIQLLEGNEKWTVKRQALEQLSVYVESYLQGFQQPQLIPIDLNKYPSSLTLQDPNELSRLWEFLNNYAQGSEYTNGDIYWQRVLAQQTLDENLLTQIHQQWSAWFSLLKQQLKAKK